MYTPSATVLAANLRACGITSARQMEEITTELLCRMPKGGTCTPGSGGGGAVQDMQVAWEPTTLKLGEMLGFFTYGDLPGITRIQFLGTTSIAGFDIESTNDLAELDFPNLVSVDPTNSQFGIFTLSGNAQLSSVLIPNLATVPSDFDIDTSPLLLSLDALSLVHSGSVYLYDNTGLADLKIPLYVPTNGKHFIASNCALNATSVELILRRFVLAGVTTCTIDLSGGTNAGLLSLSVQGQADAATLGAQLTINP